MSALGNKLQDLIASDPRRAAWVSRRMPEHLGRRIGQRKAMGLFREASSSIPAYRAVLDAHGVDPATIKDFDDFQTLPLIDKESYVMPNRERFEDMCVGGTLDHCHAIARSSGTTGQPVYWPRTVRQELSAQRGLESMWVNFFGIDDLSTLVLICFDMGMWTGGELAADLTREMAKKDRVMMVATPGSDLDETLAAVRHTSHKFQQTLIVGYPPFLRQLLERGEREGIAWKDLNVSMMAGGEGFGEVWRTYMLRRLGKEDTPTAVLGVFGSTEGLMIGLETSLSIFLRRLLEEDAALRRDIYGGETDAYALVQHSPMGSYLEIIDGEMVMTSGGATPLIRYNSHDKGGTIPFERVMGILADHGYDRERLSREGVPEHSIWRMPFLYSLGRLDSVSVDGANIFAEGLEPALLAEGMQGIRNFKLSVQEREDRLRLVVLVELAEGVTHVGADGEAERRVEHYRKTFLEQLRTVNPDFRSAHDNNPDCLTPEVLVYEHAQGPFEGDVTRIKLQRVHRGPL